MVQFVTGVAVHSAADSIVLKGLCICMAVPSVRLTLLNNVGWAITRYAIWWHSLAQSSPDFVSRMWHTNLSLKDRREVFLGDKLKCNHLTSTEFGMGLAKVGMVSIGGSTSAYFE